MVCDHLQQYSPLFELRTKSQDVKVGSEVVGIGLFNAHMPKSHLWPPIYMYIKLEANYFLFHILWV